MPTNLRRHAARPSRLRLNRLASAVAEHLHRGKTVLAALGVALVLSGCAEPQPIVFSPQDVLQIAIAAEKEIESQLGVTNGRKKDWKYTKVSRQGTTVSATTMFLDPVVVDNMRRVKDRADVKNIMDALAVHHLCKSPEHAAAINAGLVFKLTAVDPANRLLFSSTVKKC